MRGERIEMAKDSLLLFLQSLPIGCKFEIISFGTAFDCMSGGNGYDYNEQSLNYAKAQVKQFTANYGGT